MEIEESVGSDRLSELPEGLIHHILSFLPMRDVVSTSLLSKRWQNLWTTVPSLNFCDAGEFRDFVNRALIAWEGTELLEFKIDTTNSHSGWPSMRDVDVWVRFALRHRVKKLKVHMRLEGIGGYTPLRCLESSSLIRKLSIQRCILQIRGSPAWGQLKCLKMYYCYFNNYSISQILLGSPQLEVFDLRFYVAKENLHIVSANLKKLCIMSEQIEGDASLYTELQVCCPNLEILEYYGPVCKCLFTNVSSLTDVTLGFTLRLYVGRIWSDEEENELLRETLRQILPSIQHVEKVALSYWCVEVLWASPEEYLPSPLLNVKFLKFDVHSGIALDVIINLLMSFPNLKMLVVKGYSFFGENEPESYANNLLEFEYEYNFSKSFLGQLKTIDITILWIPTFMFRLIKFLLKHAPMLEKLVVRAQFSNFRDPENYFLKDKEVLLNLPRTSPTAKVIFKDMGITAL